MTTNASTKRAFRLAMYVAALGATLVLSGCNSALHPYQVAGNSMRPLLKEGDRIFVDESGYARSDLHDGEVIVIRREHAIVLKRIIAMPGETISGSDRKVFLNGKLLDEPYLAPPAGEGATDLVTFAQKTVAPGELFVMGDNLDLSLDSRTAEFAPVKLSDVVGQYRFTYWHASSTPKKN